MGVRSQDRALSSARVAKFGALPRTEEAWHEQIAKVRAEMYGTPQQPVSEDAA